MKKVLCSLVATSLFATTLISCQSNQKGTTEAETDTTKTAKSADTTTKVQSSISLRKTGNEILDVAPDAKIKTPEFSNEDVNAGFAKFETLKQDYLAAIASNDSEKIKEVKAQYIAWVKDAATWGSKLNKDESQIYIDHYTKLVTQWDKLSLREKK